MENEILGQILDELKELKQGQEELKVKVDMIDNTVSRIEKDQEELRIKVDTIDNTVNRIEKDQEELKVKVDRIDSTVIIIENVHGTKLSALYDGYQQNAQRLDRIEKRVSAQEEFVLRRVF